MICTLHTHCFYLAVNFHNSYLDYLKGKTSILIMLLGLWHCVLQAMIIINMYIYKGKVSLCSSVVYASKSVFWVQEKWALQHATSTQLCFQQAPPFAQLLSEV